MKVVIAEKPSLALDIAKALSCDLSTKPKWYYHNKSEDIYVTWVFWHLLELKQPELLNKEWWGKWSINKLPMIPHFDFKKDYRIKEGVEQQFNLIKKLCENADEIYNAWDPDREGELLIQELLNVFNLKKEAQNYRLWLLDLNKNNIKKEFDKKRKSSDYKNLFNSAFARQKADWLVWLNLTQLYTLKSKTLEERFEGVWSTWRVQSSIVKIISDRQKEIDTFIPTPYWNIKAFYNIGKEKKNLDGLFFLLKDKSELNIKDEIDEDNIDDTGVEEKKVMETRIFDKEEKDKLMWKFKTAKKWIVVDKKETIKSEEYKWLYSKTQLMSDAANILWIDTSVSSGIIDELYEKFKILSYPRTDNEYLNQSDFDNFMQILPDLLEIPKYNQHIMFMEEHWLMKPNKKFVDDNKVTAHTWLYPLMPDDWFEETYNKLPIMHQQILDLVIKSVLANMYTPYQYESSTIIIEIEWEKFKSNGNILKDKWFKSLYEEYGIKSKNKVLPQLNIGDEIEINSIEDIAKETTPPSRYSEAQLLTYLEDLLNIVNKTCDDETLKKRIKDIGGDGERKLWIGTPGTRASIIEVCLKRWYLEKKGTDKKMYYYSTPKGEALMNIVDKDFFNPITTALWEDKLRQIADGELKDTDFINEILSNLDEIINKEKPGILEKELQKPKVLEENTGACPKCWKPTIIKELFSKKTWKHFKLKECTNYIAWKDSKWKWTKKGCDWSEIVK